VGIATLLKSFHTLPK